jgi:RecJ-like exonuclease
MSLEAIPKYFFPKSTMISDSPRATASDSMTGTDWMAALGLADLKSGFGLDLFLAKMGISAPDKAVESLYQFAVKHVNQYKAVDQLETDIKQRVLQTLATFAYQDYSRSAASVRTCEYCGGEGFTDVEVFTMKSAFGRERPGEIVKITRLDNAKPSNVFHEKRDVSRVICQECKGKKVISNACRCHGKGVVLDKEQTELQGVPVNKGCPKCSGRGYARLPAENVRRAICGDVMEITQPTWSRSFKPFYEMLITQCHREESIAEEMLSKVTRGESISMN